MLFDNNTKQDTVSPLLVADVSCTCVYLTHDCLVVDLDHLVPRVDLLTLVCWRLHRRKEREREGVRGSNCYCGRWWRCSCCVCVCVKRSSRFPWFQWWRGDHRMSTWCTCPGRGQRLWFQTDHTVYTSDVKPKACGPNTARLSLGVAHQIMSKNWLILRRDVW